MPPHRLGKILENCLSRVGLQQRIQEQRIIDAWELMVGKAIAEMTEPVRVRNRVLQVKVTNSVWMHELQFHKKLIIQKLNGCAGDAVVQDLWFFIGEKEAGKEVPPEGGKNKRERQARDLSREEKERIEREISHLDDPEMREILLRVFSKGLTWEKGRIIK
jgi:predicted nucleic acid-binding Zn ribbon protein